MTPPVAISFGPFRLIASQRLLLDGDTPVRLGGRAIDLLIALVDRAGEVVGKDELLARVWPETVVEEASLRVHIGALRKALGDGQGGQRFITNVPGRGYSFVGRLVVSGSADGPVPAAQTTPHNLPVSLTRMVGQARAVDALFNVLSERRLVTVVGPGGIGKTTTALAVAERSLGRFEGGVHFVDLAVLRDPALVASSISSAIGAPVDAAAPLDGLVTHLRGKHLLLILDNCEQVVDAVATIAVHLLKGAGALRVLATSREPLRAEGEVVHRLASLSAPPRGTTQETAGQAMAWPAIQLLVERANASQDGFELADADAETAAEICRRLDGMPLAIELAAVRIGFFGLRGLLEHLNDSLRILSSGHRTALPRHQTLRALLDWSFDLLVPEVQTVLRRLSVFAGPFSLEAAATVVADEALPGDAVLEHVVDLALKSLVSTDLDGDAMRYRLLDTTRAYAADKLARSGELADVMERYAVWLATRFEQAVADWSRLPRERWLALHGQLLNGVRIVLDWSFGPGADPLSGARLLDAAVAIAQRTSSLDEYRARLRQALTLLGKIEPRQVKLEMRLNTALGSFLGQTKGTASEFQDVSRAALDAARTLGLTEHGVETVSGLWVGYFGRGDYLAALDCVLRLNALAQEAGDVHAALGAERMLAQTRHMLGQHGEARRLAARVLASDVPNRPLGNSPLLPFDRRVSMGIVMARIHWLEGRPAQAGAEAERALSYAESDIGFAICHVLAFAACPIAIWRGRRSEAQAYCERLRAEARRLSLQHWQAWADNMEVLLGGGDEFNVASADHKQWDSLAALGAPKIPPVTLERVEAGTVGWCAPEVLRARAEQLLRGDDDAAVRSQAEQLLVKALDLADQQGALAWKLRSATSLGRLHRDGPRRCEAAQRLAEVCACFEESGENPDVHEAQALRRELEATR